MQLIKQFSDLNLIYSCEDVSKLNIALEIVENTEYRNYVSNTKTIINSIENFIQETINEQIWKIAQNYPANFINALKSLLSF